MNEFERAEIVDDPGPAGDYMKRNEGGLTAKDLSHLDKRLAVLATYFERGGECRKMVEDCREVVIGLHDSWQRS